MLLQELVAVVAVIAYDAVAMRAITVAEMAAAPGANS
jgi:hypothetical protein